MDIIAGIAAATEALKLTKELRSIDHQLDKAELKLRLVDVMARLLEAREALQDANEERRTLLQKIVELNDALQRKASLKDEKGKLFETGLDGMPIGEPYCNLCYVRDGKLHRMIFYEEFGYNRNCYYCLNCRSFLAR